MYYKILTYIGSLIAIAFGMWHFFVPSIWKWYSYIDIKAPELVLAVRATNIFFSLSLVLIGVINIVLVSSRHSSKHTVITILALNIILWLTRVVLQIVVPQGKINFYIQYGMLSTFVLVLIFYVVALVLYAKGYIF
jgi:hypothetical protein